MSDTIIRLAASNDRKPSCRPINAGNNAQLACAYFELEVDIQEALHMARIAVQRLMETFGRPPSLNGGTPHRWDIGEEDAEADMFAVTQVWQMLADLKKKYLSAFPNRSSPSERTL